MRGFLTSRATSRAQCASCASRIATLLSRTVAGQRMNRTYPRAASNRNSAAKLGCCVSSSRAMVLSMTIPCTARLWLRSANEWRGQMAISAARPIPSSRGLNSQTSAASKPRPTNGRSANAAAPAATRAVRKNGKKVSADTTSIEIDIAYSNQELHMVRRSIINGEL